MVVEQKARDVGNFQQIQCASYCRILLCDAVAGNRLVAVVAAKQAVSMIAKRLTDWLECRIWLARIAARGRGTAPAIPLALGWAMVGVLAYHVPGLALCAGLVAVAVILIRAAWGDCPALREPPSGPCQK
jgi:hypothetical protein